MKPERWQRIRDLFHEALGRDEADREAFVRREAGTDEDLYSQVFRMLQGESAPESFIEPPGDGEFGASVQTAPENLAGQKLGEFLLSREIGRGGMGIVYLAEQEPLGRQVAVKVLPPVATLSTDLVERFRREALAPARTRHPGIVQVLSFGKQGGIYYYAMEYVDGPNLKEVLDGKRQNGEDLGVPFDVDDPEACAQMVEKIALALHYAHESGVIHRDVKPQNCLLYTSPSPRD